jgi:hypothetical protein
VIPYEEDALEAYAIHLVAKDSLPEGRNGGKEWIGRGRMRIYFCTDEGSVKISPHIKYGGGRQKVRV